jgi:hypothetical protein
LKQLFIICIFTVVACNKSNEEADKKSQVNVAKRVDKDSDFGFDFTKYNVVRYSSKKATPLGLSSTSKILKIEGFTISLKK